MTMLEQVETGGSDMNVKWLLFMKLLFYFIEKN